MGLFSSIGKAFKSIVSPVREVAEKVVAPIAATGAFGPAGIAGAAILAPKTTARTLTGLAGAAGTFTSNLGLPGAGQAAPMAAPVSQLVAGAPQGPFSAFQPASFLPQPVSQPGIFPQAGPMAIPVMAAAPQIAAGAAGLAGRFARLFPNLFNWIQTQRASGIPMTMAKLRALGKRFGVINLVTLGLLTSDLAVDLLIADSMGFGKARRTNFGNVTALRRSMRRVEGFHRLCQKSDMLRRRGGGGRRRSPSRRNGVVIAQN